MAADSLIPGILSTPGLATGINAPSQKTDSPQKTKDAAVQFESLLVGQILKSAHEEDGGWLGAGEDQTAGSAMQMADEYFAKALTSHGGLGLARMISASLDQATARTSSHTTPSHITPNHTSPAK
jgi:Rod binding domain-containing protein